MLEVAAFYCPEHVYLLGDYADMYDIHQHGPKDPRMVTSLTDEVVAVIAGLDEIDALFPDARKHFIQGNHEYRLERYIQNRCPELFGFVTWEQLLQLDKRPKWSWHKYGPGQRVQVAGSRLWARHEPLASSAAATARKALCSLVYGHTHRIDTAKQRGLLCEHVVFSCGWLGDERKDEVFGYVKGHYAWQMGFAVVDVDPETGDFYPQVIQIRDDYKAIFQGRKFKG